jgi:hypothetical protein
MDELADAFEVETNISNIIAIGLTFMDKVHCEPMNNKWGKPDRGYISLSYDKEAKEQVGKPCVGWYNTKTLGWISELAEDLFDRYKDDTYQIKRWVKSYKTKIRNVVNNKANIFTIRFFADFLEEKYKDEIESILLIKQIKIEHDDEHALTDGGASPSNIKVDNDDIDESDIPF